MDKVLSRFAADFQTRGSAAEMEKHGKIFEDRAKTLRQICVAFDAVARNRQLLSSPFLDE
ncbi:MAG: hypothetical protein LBI05_10785 [Planctomycetaceae bacterium]|jgi:hypothetical protein|nr:hypothetical protein [Planctomycetaceae bacterium]